MKRTVPLRILSAALGLALLSAVPALTVAAEEDDLAGYGSLPGEEAPPLVVSQWLRGEKLDGYESDRVTLVDLWATWCGPCLASMPKLRALEEKHSSGLTVVALNVWERHPARVPRYLEAHGDSMPQRVALDSIPPGKDVNEGIMASQLLGSSEHVSIPRTYVIDRSGRMAWVGHPLAVEEPLEAILDGTWDTEQFAREYVERQREERRYRVELDRIEQALNRQDWRGAYELCEEITQANPEYTGRLVNQGYVRIVVGALRSGRTDGGSLSGEKLEVSRLAVARAIELDDQNQWRLLLLAGDVERAAGAAEEAVKYYQAALEGAPAQFRPVIEQTLQSIDPLTD